MELALDEPTEKDEVFEEDGVTYIIDRRLFDRVKPLRIEFIQNAEGTGLEVTHTDAGV